MSFLNKHWIANGSMDVMDLYEGKAEMYLIPAASNSSLQDSIVVNTPTGGEPDGQKWTSTQGYRHGEV